MAKENLALYERFRNVPKEAQKAFNNGRFSGTDINPMWRIKMLTEEFGPCGLGWYAEVVHRNIEKSGETMCTFIGLNLYVKYNGEWSKPIYGEGGNTFSSQTKSGYAQISDEAYKMAYTDALSNAAKQLGLGADVWWDKDVTKYTAPQNQAPQQKAPAPKTKEQVAVDKAAVQELIQKLNLAKTSAEVGKIWQDHPQFKMNVDFKKAVADRGTELKAQGK